MRRLLALPLILMPALALAQAYSPGRPVSDTNPQPIKQTTSSATSTATTGSTSATATVAFTPQLGRPIRLIAKLTAGTSFSAQVFTSPDACTTLNALTVAGQPWASFTGQTSTVNEDVDVPMIAGVVYCLTITPGSGATVSYAVRQ